MKTLKPREHRTEQIIVENINKVSKDYKKVPLMHTVE
jgi:hypothetical protein